MATSKSTRAPARQSVLPTPRTGEGSTTLKVTASCSSLEKGGLALTADAHDTFATRLAIKATRKVRVPKTGMVAARQEMKRHDIALINSPTGATRNGKLVRLVSRVTKGARLKFDGIEWCAADSDGWVVHVHGDDLLEVDVGNEVLLTGWLMVRESSLVHLGEEPPAPPAEPFEYAQMAML